jgi:DNA polymerase-1
MGDAVEIMGLPEIRERWGVERAEQVVDVLALMGDSSDNIPGVPGIGEKTAIKLIGQFGTLENLLAHTGELKGRQKQMLEEHGELARISKRLATIVCDVPCPVDLETLKLQKPHDDGLKSLFVEFEFNSIGRRLFGEEFKAGRGPSSAGAESRLAASSTPSADEDLALETEVQSTAPSESPQVTADLKSIADTQHQYQIKASSAERAELVRLLLGQAAVALDLQTSNPDPKEARVIGLAFSFAPHTGYYVPMPQDATEARKVLEEFVPVLGFCQIEKVGHNLKSDLTVLKWQGVAVEGKLFDTMIAHSLIEPDLRHSMNYLCEVYLGYTPIPGGKPSGEPQSDQLNLATGPTEKMAERACEKADLAWQLRGVLEPLLKEKSQQRVFYEVESPLVPVLVDMEFEGIKLDSAALADFAAQLGKEIDEQEKSICRLAGTPFNLNSPRQLGQILFDVMKICAPPKKTKSGQYSTDEQTLLALAPDHEIVRRLLDHRAATKLKSTYADALPVAIWPPTGRVHTTYNQVMTATGRLNSQNPNLQNIPIRTERGQEIRKAFVPRSAEYLLLSADYSQIELRIIAALSREPGLLDAFKSRADIHTATAAKVYGVFPETVTPEMRRKAKMVNYGIAYGISAFGLAQRLGIPRKEAAEIIDQYFKQFPGIRKYMDDTIAFARKNGFVETVTGRRRYLRDIRSSNNTIRSAAERNAINAPIQGSAADMIKLAMINIHRELVVSNLKTRMLLQVHDELVFDLYRPEEKTVRAIVEEKMKHAIALDVPIEVEIGVGKTWLEAH